ncbi:MAG: hypothetical protein ACHREM_26380, partial [Polyangiales bacterium]
RGHFRAGAEAAYADDDHVANVRAVNTTTNGYDVEVSMSRPGKVVFDTHYDRGWSIVDGGPGGVTVAHEALLAVALPAGDRKLSIRYRPVGLPIGVAVSALTIGAMIGSALFSWRKRRGLSSS